MTQQQFKFPLINRVIVLVFSLSLVIGMPVAVVRGMAAPNFPDTVRLFVLLVFFLMGCGGVWLSLFFKNRTSEELEEEQSFPSADQPDIPEDSLVYRFPSGIKSAAIHVDTVDEVLHFYNCHAPRKFLSSAIEWFSCPVADVQAVHAFRYRGEALTVVTAQGKATIPEGGADYSALRETLRELIPFTEPGFSADHPLMGMVYLFGALLGLAAGFSLTPPNAGDETLGLLMLVGAFVGVAVCYALVWAGDRLIGISLVQPIGFGALGFGVGLHLLVLLQQWIGGGFGMITTVLTTSVIFGGLFGFWKQNKENLQPEQDDDASNQTDHPDA